MLTPSEHTIYYLLTSHQVVVYLWMPSFAKLPKSNQDNFPKEGKLKGSRWKSHWFAISQNSRYKIMHPDLVHCAQIDATFDKKFALVFENTWRKIFLEENDRANPQKEEEDNLRFQWTTNIKVFCRIGCFDPSNFPWTELTKCFWHQVKGRSLHVKLWKDLITI